MKEKLAPRLGGDDLTSDRGTAHNAASSDSFTVQQEMTEDQFNVAMSIFEEAIPKYELSARELGLETMRMTNQAIGICLLGASPPPLLHMEASGVEKDVAIALQSCGFEQVPFDSLVDDGRFVKVFRFYRPEDDRNFMVECRIDLPRRSTSKFNGVDDKAEVRLQAMLMRDELLFLSNWLDLTQEASRDGVELTPEKVLSFPHENIASLVRDDASSLAALMLEIVPTVQSSGLKS